MAILLREQFLAKQYIKIHALLMARRFACQRLTKSGWLRCAKGCVGRFFATKSCLPSQRWPSFFKCLAMRYKHRPKLRVSCNWPKSAWRRSWSIRADAHFSKWKKRSWGLGRCTKRPFHSFSHSALGSAVDLTVTALLPPSLTSGLLGED